MARGRFITFEGMEGSGKSTQLRRVAEVLRADGQSVCETLEPGGTGVGNALRDVLLNPKYGFSHPSSELLLFTVDRLEHVASVVEPALIQGQTVLCDRYVDSTWAYQAGGRELPADLVASALQFTPLMPDLTLVLDVPVEVGLARAKRRSDLDRFEQEALAFHHRVRDWYVGLADEFPDRVICIDGNRDPDDVFESVLTAIRHT